MVTLFDFLPQMDSFAAFGIKAQWRKKLDEAEEILEQLKQSTKASAQLGYYFATQLGNPRLHLRVGKGGVEFLIEPLNDGGGCVGGRGDAVPRARLIA